MKQIKGYTQTKKELKSPMQMGDFGGATWNMASLVNNLRAEMNRMVNDKMAEMDDVIEESKQTAKDNTKKVDDKVSEFHSTAVGLIKDIKNIPHIKGKDADDQAITMKVLGSLPNEDSITERVLSRIPKVDEAILTRKILSALPENKASLKIIQEKFEVDPMSVIEKIMALPSGKFKLKKENIEGLEQTMSAFSNQLGRGYLHGGGDTVAAGSNVTITTNNNGQKVISSTGGIGVFYTETPTGLINSSNKVYTVLHSITAVFSLAINGELLHPDTASQTNDFSFSGTTITFHTALDSSLSGTAFTIVYI